MKFLRAWYRNFQKLLNSVIKISYINFLKFGFNRFIDIHKTNFTIIVSFFHVNTAVTLKIKYLQMLFDQTFVL